MNKILNVLFTNEKCTVTARSKQSINKKHIQITISYDESTWEISSIFIRSVGFDDEIYQNQDIIPDNIELALQNIPSDHSRSSLKHKFLNQLKYSGDEGVLTKEYKQYNTDMESGFLAGLGTYCTFLYLLNNGLIDSEIPFPMTFPYRSNHLDSLNNNAFSVLSSPLMAFTKLASGPALHMGIFIQTFINSWGFMFVEGNPQVNENKILPELLNSMLDILLITREECNKLKTEVEDMKKMMNEMWSSTKDIETRYMNIMDSITDIQHSVDNKNIKNENRRKYIARKNMRDDKKFALLGISEKTQDNSSKIIQTNGKIDIDELSKTKYHVADGSVVQKLVSVNTDGDFSSNFKSTQPTLVAWR